MDSGDPFGLLNIPLYRNRSLNVSEKAGEFAQDLFGRNDFTLSNVNSLGGVDGFQN